MTTGTRESAPPGIAKQWPTLLMIKLGRITMHRFTEALEPFGIRPRHVAALIELRDSGQLTQQSLCGQLHLDPTNLVAILNELEDRGYANRRRDPADRRRHLVEVSKKGLTVIEKASGKMPPPAPWITRPRIITNREEAIAEIRVPNASISSTIISRRSFPYMSPSRPMIGVVTEALSRYAVSTQPTAPSEVWRELWISGSAGKTNDCMSA